MERGSDQHGPRVDEALERETSSIERGSPTDSRAEEGRQQEAPADREPVPDSHLSDAGTAPGESLGRDREEASREIARSLDPSVFPADRERLIEAAVAGHAREPVVEALRGLPSGITYEGSEDVVERVLGA